jgi:hypothetical protein
MRFSRSPQEETAPVSISDANMKMSVAQWESTTYQGLKVRIRWLNSFELAAFETSSGLAGSSGGVGPSAQRQ